MSTRLDVDADDDDERVVQGSPAPELWEAYRRTPTASVHEALVAHYLPLARRVASRVFRLHPATGVAFDDYLQYGRVGLLECIERFDPGRGVPFEAFAFHRIRGAILNGLAQESELAAQREASRRVLRERRASIAAGALPRPDQASLEELVEMTMGLAIGVLLDDAADAPDENDASNPYARVELQQLRSALRRAVEQLPEREAELIRTHYFEHREFQEVAERWGVTKGRVSQLHARAVQLLREQVCGAPHLNRRL